MSFHLVGNSIYLFILFYFFIYLSEEVDQNTNDKKHNKPERTQMATKYHWKVPLKIKIKQQT